MKTGGGDWALSMFYCMKLVCYWLVVESFFVCVSRFADWRPKFCIYAKIIKDLIDFSYIQKIPASRARGPFLIYTKTSPSRYIYKKNSHSGASRGTNVCHIYKILAKNAYIHFQ